MVYIKCFAVLLDNFCESKIVEEKNFAINDVDGRKQFFKKYNEEKYQCFQVTLEC